MKKKKFAAIVLAAVMAVTSVPFTGLAETKSGNEDPWWTVVPSAYKDGKDTWTGYFANGNPVTIEEKGSKTYMYRDGDETDQSKWVELTATASDAQYAAVIAGTAPGGESVTEGSIHLKSGTVRSLIGSNGENGAMSQVEITVDGGTIKAGVSIVEPKNQAPSFEKCDDRRVEKGIININGGSIGSLVRGTFSYSQVNDLEINVKDGSIGKDVYGGSIYGGSNGHVGKYVLNVSGGTVAGDVFAGQRALVDTYSFNFTGGEIKGGIFPGSSYSDLDNGAGTSNWSGWGIGDINYSVANDVDIRISGNAKYTDIMGSFQNVKEDVARFNEKYSSTNNYTAWNPYYNFDSLNTSTTITLGVKPSGRPASGYRHCLSLTENQVDGVTVITPALGIELDKTAAELQLGDSIDLKASLKKISSTAATASNATVKWESSDESLVAVAEDNDDNAKAKATVIGYKAGAGTVTLTASVEGEKDILPATCNIKITEPKLEVSVSPSTISYDGEAKVAAKLVNVKIASASDAEISYEAEAPAEVDADGIVTSDDTGAFGKAKITANANYGEFEIASGSTEVNIKQPEMRIVSDASYLDMKETNTIDLELESSCNYDDYEWTVDDSSVAEINGTLDVATLTAKKAGTVTVKAKGIPASELENVQGAFATKKFTIRDSRKFAWKGQEKPSITLTINDETKSDTQTLEIIDDYGNAKWSVDNNEIAAVTPSADGKSAAVKGLAAGSTTLTVESPESDETTALSVAIVVVDAKANVKIETVEPEIVIKEGLIDNIQAPEMDLEGLTDEQKQQVETLAPVIEAQAKQAAQEAINDVIVNKAVKSDVPTGLDVIVKEAGLLSDGEQAAVYMSHEIVDVTVEAKTIVKEDGTVEVKTYVTSMVFEIQPFIAAIDQNGKKVSGTETGIADVVNAASGRVTFKIPVPANVEFGYADVTHLGKTERCRINSNSDGKFIRMSVSHFSEFSVKFVDYTPVSGGSGARAGSVKEYIPAEPGKWMQNETGWWYRYDNGTYPAAQWVMLPWNGVNNWYHFDVQGYLTAGWLQDGGHTYYLHPYADGNRGYMYTGWHEIDGKWYYFHIMEGGPLGAMAVNTKTPDGFYVGSDGIWLP